MTAITTDTGLTIKMIVGWFNTRAFGLYGGEAVTQLQHALQCAASAQAAGAGASLTAAALLHDIGHLAESEGDVVRPHGALAAALLGNLFAPAVTEPIRLHIDAKRYLCAVDDHYWASLSNASKKSLGWQGGPFTKIEAQAFRQQPFADDAIHLRRWDDAAKVAGFPTPPMATFVPMLEAVAIADARFGNTAFVSA